MEEEAPKKRVHSSKSRCVPLPVLLLMWGGIRGADGWRSSEGRSSKSWRVVGQRDGGERGRGEQVNAAGCKPV
jgi:hypothetical protein